MIPWMMPEWNGCPAAFTSGYDIKKLLTDILPATGFTKKKYRQPDQISRAITGRYQEAAAHGAGNESKPASVSAGIGTNIILPSQCGDGPGKTWSTAAAWCCACVFRQILLMISWISGQSLMMIPWWVWWVWKPAPKTEGCCKRRHCHHWLAAGVENIWSHAQGKLLQKITDTVLQTKVISIIPCENTWTTKAGKLYQECDRKFNVHTGIPALLIFWFQICDFRFEEIKNILPLQVL